MLPLSNFAKKEKSAIGVNKNKILGKKIKILFLRKLKFRKLKIAKLENWEKRKLQMHLEKKESFGFFKKKEESTWPSVGSVPNVWNLI